MIKNLENRIKRVLSDISGYPLKDIEIQFSSDKVNNWDSLEHMNLISAIEDEFIIELKESEIINMTNYETILKILKSNYSIE